MPAVPLAPLTPRAEAAGPRPPGWLRLAVLLVAAATFAGGFVVAHTLFPDRSGNNDEAVYVYQAQLLRHGHLTMPVDDLTDFVRPWMSGPHDGRLVMVFQPVFPGVLAASDLLFGSMHVAVAAIAAAGVLLAAVLAREALGDDHAALVAAVAFAASPLVVVHSGLFLEYLFAVVLEMAVLILVLRSWRSTGTRRLRLLVAAGVVHGVLFFTRPLEALVLGVVVVVHAACAARRDRAEIVRTAGFVVLGAAPVLVLCLAYNTAVTGNPLRFALWATGGDNAFGFGARRIAAGSPATNFRLHDAWFALRANVRAFPHWIAGGVLALPFMAYGVARLWREGRRAVVVALGALTLLVPGAYFFYWGNLLIAMNGRNLYGPHYYLALLIPAVVTLSAGVVGAVRAVGRAVGGARWAVGRAVGGARWAVPLAGAAVAALAIVGTAVEAGDKLDANRRSRDAIAAELDTVRDGVDGPAVVLVPVGADGPYLLHPRGAMANRPDLAGDLLYAVDLGGRNNELADRFADRTLYRFQRVDTPDGNRPDLQRLTARHASSYRARVRLTNTTTQPTATLYARNDAGDTAVCVLDRRSGRGRAYDTATFVLADRVVMSGCEGGDVTLGLPSGASVLALGAAFGPTPDPQTAVAYEQRLWLRTRDGSVDLLTPPDTWLRGAADTPYRVVEPSSSFAVVYD